MIDIETTLDVDAPADDVFAFVADQTNATHWQKGLKSVRRLTPGPIRAGSEHEFERRLAGIPVKSRNRFTAYSVEDRSVVFEIPKGWVSGEASYRVEPLSPGSCRLTSAMRFDISGPPKLFERSLAKTLERDSARDEAKLKALLEARARGGQPPAAHLQ